MGSSALLAPSNYGLLCGFSIAVCTFENNSFIKLYSKSPSVSCVSKRYVICFLLGSWLCTFFVVFLWDVWEADAKTRLCVWEAWWKSDPEWRRMGRKIGWKHSRLPCNLKKVWQGRRGVLKSKLAIRGVTYLPEWACLSLPAVLSHW